MAVSIEENIISEAQQNARDDQKNDINTDDDIATEQENMTDDDRTKQ